MVKALTRVLCSIEGLQMKRKWVVLTQMDHAASPMLVTGRVPMHSPLCWLGKCCSALTTLKGTDTLCTCATAPTVRQCRSADCALFNFECSCLHKDIVGALCTCLWRKQIHEKFFKSISLFLCLFDSNLLSFYCVWGTNI